MALQQPLLRWLGGRERGRGERGRGREEGGAKKNKKISLFFFLLPPPVFLFVFPLSFLDLSPLSSLSNLQLVGIPEKSIKPRERRKTNKKREHFARQSSFLSPSLSLPPLLLLPFPFSYQGNPHSAKIAIGPFSLTNASSSSERASIDPAKATALGEQKPLLPLRRGTTTATRRVSSRLNEKG